MQAIFTGVLSTKIENLLKKDVIQCKDLVSDYRFQRIFMRLAGNTRLKTVGNRSGYGNENTRSPHHVHHGNVSNNNYITLND